MSNIINICLTGRPCSGKTSTINRLKSLNDLNGYKVLTVPEASTLLAANNMSYDDNYYGWQESIFDLQIHLFNIFNKYAETLNNDTLIIHDRGVHDTLSFCTYDLSVYLLDKHNIKDPYNLYEYTIHLVSVAYDKPEEYNLNNQYRRENLKEAVEAEKRNIKSTERILNYSIVDNSTDFEGKYNTVLNIIKNQIEQKNNIN